MKSITPNKYNTLLLSVHILTKLTNTNNSNNNNTSNNDYNNNTSHRPHPPTQAVTSNNIITSNKNNNENNEGSPHRPHPPTRAAINNNKVKYTHIEPKALNLLINAFNILFTKYLNILNKQITHSEKSKLNIIDLYNSVFVPFINKLSLFQICNDILNDYVNINNNSNNISNIISHNEVDLYKLRLLPYDNNTNDNTNTNDNNNTYNIHVKGIVDPLPYLLTYTLHRNTITDNNNILNTIIMFPPPHTFKHSVIIVDSVDRNSKLMLLGKQRLAVKGSLVGLSLLNNNNNEFNNNEFNNNSLLDESKLRNSLLDETNNKKIKVTNNEKDYLDYMNYMF